ncbi:MAG: V-type ATP synthase subunit F [Spirochaetales bacterium]
MKYYIIGEHEPVLAFALVGVEGIAVVNRGEAIDAFNRITGQTGGQSGLPTEGRPKVLILTENVADMLADEILHWQMTGDYPLVVEIPGIHGHIEGRKTLTESIREAIGIHV